jgi:putative RecB family exonuclease
MEQLGFDGMPTRLITCTPSKLGAYEDCPRKYRMVYVERPAPPKGPPWAHTSLGSAVHNALRAWWGLARPRRSPEAARALVHAAWIPEGFRDDRQQEEARERAAGWIEAYLRDVDPDAEPVGLERTVATKTGTLAFSGRIDRLDDRDGDLVVVDYKTGRSVLSTDDARGSAALALYAVATSRTLRRPCRRVELHHLPTGTVHAYEHTDESLARHVGRAEATAADIVRAEEAVKAGADPDQAFPARTGQHCSWCDFRRHCAPGRAAAPGKEPWAAITHAAESAPAAPVVSGSRHDAPAASGDNS